MIISQSHHTNAFVQIILPIVILSAKNQVNDLVIASEAGANDYLTKPFSRNELLARLQVHLDLQTSVREQIKQSNSFERFVPSKFINLLDKQSVSDVELEDAKLKNMSVLFTDIRSFTTLSEKMTPEESFKLLNSYLKRMEPRNDIESVSIIRGKKSLIA